ncbi:MAG: hypothetical protein JW861_08235 [Bacteroidales bacterium]|nr:hypothetical protein [Bacteroidales bacterium]
MVNPVFIIVVLLGAGFLLGLFRKTGISLARVAGLLALAFPLYVSVGWMLHFIGQTAQPYVVYTAGTVPPFSINLRMGPDEAFLTAAINMLGFFGFIYLFRLFKSQGVSTIILYLVLFMGLNVIVMTRDIFNLFVFLEIASIALIGLVLVNKGIDALSAGFKYLIAVSVISSILLVGIGFIYYYSGTLNIDGFIENNSLVMKGLSTAVFLVLVAVVLELKAFPANGWALDVYQSAHPGISALISAGTATASLFVLYKLLPFGGHLWLQVAAVIGLVTFVGSNMLGIAQKNANRLLGYSSVGQIGLLVAVIGFSDDLGSHLRMIFFGLFISHFLSKAGLFWLSGMAGEEEISKWSVLRKKPALLLIFGMFVFSLIGFPPFPSFYGKWQLVMDLSGNGQILWIALILLGTMFEGVYLFRWLGFAIKHEVDESKAPDTAAEKMIPAGAFALLLLGASWVSNAYFPGAMKTSFLPLYFILFLFLIDFLPLVIKNTLSILSLGYYGWRLYPSIQDDTLRLVFAGIFLIGGMLTLFAGYSEKGKRPGFYPFALMMYAGLIGLVEADNLFGFFFAWELMTMGSYILIIRGKKSLVHAYNYMLFSLGGALLILFGIALTVAGQPDISLSMLASPAYPGWAYALLAVGFLTKTAALGLHIWLPGAHAEAESDVSPMVSGILLKAGAFGLVILFLAMGGGEAGRHPLLYALGWLGALTALGGNLMAVFQEDAKRLLAYSSVGNLGYILFAFSFMTHIGWLTGLTYSINHFLFKTLLFLAIGGVVMRVKTHNMYEMGGLIKRMPWSFIAVLVGIITLAGIPPLSGFAGKWLFYNAVIAKGWFLQGALVFFAGTIAFLYCFKLIYSVFLGQEKDRFRKVKEAPVWYIIPQFILIVGIMIFSARPEIVLKPIGALLSQAAFFPSEPLAWENVTAYTNLGYWSGFNIMLVIGAMFVVLLGWLLLMSRKAQKVKQFNIVYAGEAPFTPETTHFSHNMFAPYNKALGFLIHPVATQFWLGVNNTFHALAESARKIYSGNGQSYIIHIVAYIVVVYLILS